MIICHWSWWECTLLDITCFVTHTYKYEICCEVKSVNYLRFMSDSIPDPMPDSGRKPEPDPKSRLKSMYILIKNKSRTHYILFKVIK